MAGALTDGYDQLSDTCREKLFPLTLGGYNGNDLVSCTLNFKEHNIILVAGNSTSDDFGPSSESHGYVSAVDIEGNVMWGHYFTNNSASVSTISGCFKNSEGTAVFMGMSNEIPVIFEVNPKTGLIQKFVTLDKLKQESEKNSYVTFGGILHDTEDPVDKLPYYYLSYIEDDKLVLTKINSDTLEVKFFNRTFIETNDQSDWQNRKVANQLIQDQSDPTKMFLIGQFFGRAAVVKFNKINFFVEFKLEVKKSGEGAPFSEMNEILSVAVSPREPDAIYACGYKWTDPNTQEFSNAVTMKIKTDGTIDFLDVWVANETNQRDSCRSVFYDETNNVAVFLMEVIRPTYKDVLVVPMTPNGGFDFGAFNLEYGFSPIDFRLAAHSAFESEGQYYFGGFSKGFNTKI